MIQNRNHQTPDHV